MRQTFLILASSLFLFGCADTYSPSGRAVNGGLIGGAGGAAVGGLAGGGKGALIGGGTGAAGGAAIGAATAPRPRYYTY